MEDTFKKVTERRTVSEANRYSEQSKQRLMRSIQKRLTTAFIGAIAKMELFVGADLWGHGKDDEDCTEAELRWRDTWEECRNEILNNGNNQIRGMESELKNFDVSFRKTNSIPFKG